MLAAKKNQEQPASKGRVQVTDLALELWRPPRTQFVPKLPTPQEGLLGDQLVLSRRPTGRVPMRLAKL